MYYEANGTISVYEDRMLDAFVQKPAKIPFYRDLYERATRYGAPKLCWKWSWWAFFGGALFPLYRKAYMATLCVCGINLALTILALGFLPVDTIKHIEKSLELGILPTEADLSVLRAFAFRCYAMLICAEIFVSGFVPYFIIKRYCELKEAIENKYADENERVSVMASHGGFHQWVVKLVIGFVVFINAILLLALVAALSV
jgi:hypothetical protein